MLICDKSGALVTIDSLFKLKVSVGNGIFAPPGPAGRKGRCPGKIWCYPKGYSPTGNTGGGSSGDYLSLLKCLDQSG